MSALRHTRGFQQRLRAVNREASAGRFAETSRSP